MDILLSYILARLLYILDIPFCIATICALAAVSIVLSRIRSNMLQNREPCWH